MLITKSTLVHRKNLSLSIALTSDMEIYMLLNFTSARSNYPRESLLDIIELLILPSIAY